MDWQFVFWGLGLFIAFSVLLSLKRLVIRQPKSGSRLPLLSQALILFAISTVGAAVIEQHDWGKGRLMSLPQEGREAWLAKGEFSAAQRRLIESSPSMDWWAYAEHLEARYKMLNWLIAGGVVLAVIVAVGLSRRSPGSSNSSNAQDPNKPSPASEAIRMLENHGYRRMPTGQDSSSNEPSG